MFVVELLVLLDDLRLLARRPYRQLHHPRCLSGPEAYEEQMSHDSSYITLYDRYGHLAGNIRAYNATNAILAYVV